MASSKSDKSKPHARAVSEVFGSVVAEPAPAEAPETAPVPDTQPEEPPAEVTTPEPEPEPEPAPEGSMFGVLESPPQDEFLGSFRRRDFIEPPTLTEFADASGTYVAAFGHPDPTHVSSYARLLHVYGYKPADPDNPAHRAMFPRCIPKDGYLVDLDGNIACLYPKEYYEEHQRRRLNSKMEPPGTGKTYNADIETPDREFQENLRAAATSVIQKPEDAEAVVSRAVERAVRRAPSRVQEQIRKFLDTNQRT